MISLSSRQNALRLIADNPNWNIIDIGAGRFPISRANVATDIEPWHEEYKKRSTKFVQTESLSVFQDNEFDFAWCSHVLEHVPNPPELLLELQRIARAGYIEVPSPLFCNLVQGNEMGHKSHIRWDAEKEELIIAPHRQILRPLLHYSELKLLYPFFRPEMVTELIWTSDFRFRLVEEVNFPDERFWFDFEENWQDLESDRSKGPVELGAASKLKFRALERSRNQKKNWLRRIIRRISRLLRQYAPSK